MIKKFSRVIFLKFSLFFGWYLCFLLAGYGILVDKFWLVLVAQACAFLIWLAWRIVERRDTKKQ